MDESKRIAPVPQTGPAYVFSVAATVRSRDGDVECLNRLSPLENSARDLTVAATLNGYGPAGPVGGIWPFFKPLLRKQDRLFVCHLPEGDLRIAHPPHEPRSSRREEAHSFSGEGSQSLLTSAATVQGFNARRLAWENSLPDGTPRRVPRFSLGSLLGLSPGRYQWITGG